MNWCKEEIEGVQELNLVGLHQLSDASRKMYFLLIQIAFYYVDMNKTIF